MQAAPSPDSRSGFSAIPGFGGQSTQNSGGNSLAASPNTVNDIEDKVLVGARQRRVGMQ
ncbi:MAG TPA: hypothetical protein VFN42_12705 [Acetobacteraceae bacterium]|nr:hypothetical protein [Acetobacteraceae bacterium]